eukprot:403350305
MGSMSSNMCIFNSDFESWSNKPVIQVLDIVFHKGWIKAKYLNGVIKYLREMTLTFPLQQFLDELSIKVSNLAEIGFILNQQINPVKFDIMLQNCTKLERLFIKLYLKKDFKISDYFIQTKAFIEKIKFISITQLEPNRKIYIDSDFKQIQMRKLILNYDQKERITDSSILKFPSKLKHLSISNIQIEQELLEQAIHACSELSMLKLIDAETQGLNLRDIYYLKEAVFKIGSFDRQISLSNCPNLEILKSNSLISLAQCESKLIEFHYDIEQNQQEVIQRINDKKIMQGLYQKEQLLLTLIDYSKQGKESCQLKLKKVFIKPFFHHDYNLLQNITECTVYNIADKISLTRNQGLIKLELFRASQKLMFNLLQAMTSSTDQQMARKFQLLFNPNHKFINCKTLNIALGLNSKNLNQFLLNFPHLQNVYIKIKEVDNSERIEFKHPTVVKMHLECDKIQTNQSQHLVVCEVEDLKISEECKKLRSLKVSNFGYIKNIVLEAPQLSNLMFDGLLRNKSLTYSKSLNLRKMMFKGLVLDIDRINQLTSDQIFQSQFDKKTWVPKIVIEHGDKQEYLQKIQVLFREVGVKKTVLQSQMSLPLDQQQMQKMEWTRNQGFKGSQQERDAFNKIFQSLKESLSE